MRLQGQGTKPKHGELSFKVERKAYFKSHKICYLGLSEDKNSEEMEQESLLNLRVFFPLIWNGLKWWITSRATTTCGKGEKSIKNKGFSFSSLKPAGKKRGFC